MSRRRESLSLLGGLALACVAVAAAPLTFVGRWEVIAYDPDEAPGKSQVSLWLHADAWIKNPAPPSPYVAQGWPIISIQCVDGQPEFFINVNFEVPAGVVAVTYRLDEGAAVDATWKSDAIAIEPDDKVAFVRSLLGKRKLSLTVTFPGAAPTSTTFAIARLETALEAVRPRCSW